VEPLHTRVLFGVSHFGFTTYYGEFSGVSGALDLDAKNPSASKLDIRIPVAGIGTTNAELNGELKGEEWFDTAKYPNITASHCQRNGHGIDWHFGQSLAIQTG
jgi:polyisoprenoid-binding protein YceI